MDLSGVDVDDEDKVQSPLLWYFLFRAVGAFASEFKRHPGSQGSSTHDVEWLMQKARALAAENDELASWISVDHATEMTRSCEVELHNIAALMGGVASQEIIKIITHQFLPLNHTYIFNGITGNAATYVL